MGPVLEDLPLAEQARHRRARIVADPRAEHDAVAALDGRDRVELDAREAPDGLEHLAGGAFPAPRRVALVRDDVAAQLVESDPVHAD